VSVSDFKAISKWKKIPNHIQEKLVSNVFCSTCGVTTIVNYSIQDASAGIVLEGECKTCGAEAARFIENM
jgi:transcription elongation factor Elf1